MSWPVWTLGTLSPARQAEVLAALAAVETADTPVPPAAFRALIDPTERAVLQNCLAEAGRVLLNIDGGYLSGYDDQVADRLAADGIGVLDCDDRAVMALVLLYCVAIPRAAGRIRGQSWLDAEETSYDQLNKSQLPRTRIEASVRRLRHAGMLGYGQRRQIKPGPQFARFTPRTSDGLWEDLILLAAPSGVMADTIRRRRLARTTARLAAATITAATTTPSSREQT